MERIVQYVKDGAKLFDNYIPFKDGCDEEYEENLLRSIMIMLMKHG